MSIQPALEAAFRNASPGNQEARSDGANVGNIMSEVKDSGKALWQDVYENPGKTAMVAGAVVLGAAALYASRGLFIKDVLLVEDTPYMGQAMKSALETNGERVTWITGISSAKPLTGTTLEGKNLVLDMSRFKIALVDGELVDSEMQGDAVVHALRHDGISSIGTSSVPEINNLMLANGASVAAPKATIVSALVDNSLDLRTAVRTPASEQVRLDALTDQLKGPTGKALRQKGNQFLMNFLQQS